MHQCLRLLAQKRLHGVEHRWMYLSSRGNAGSSLVQAGTGAVSKAKLATHQKGAAHMCSVIQTDLWMRSEETPWYTAQVALTSSSADNPGKVPQLELSQVHPPDTPTKQFFDLRR